MGSPALADAYFWLIKETQSHILCFCYRQNVILGSTPVREFWEVLMRETRRRLLVTLAGVAAGAIAAPSTLTSQMGPPQPMPSPNAPHNQNVPAGMDSPDLIKQNQSSVSPLAWTQIKSDTQKLFQMTSDFRDHVQQTNLTSTLPLPLIKEARQIEKLAKQIQEHMKG